MISSICCVSDEPLQPHFKLRNDVRSVAKQSKNSQATSKGFDQTRMLVSRKSHVVA